MKRCLPILLAAPAFVWGEEWTPPKNTNAALGYWRAFDLASKVELKDDEAAWKIATGAAPWDEAAFGPVVEAGADAFHELRNASRLPDCDFGLNYDEGMMMSMPHLSRAKRLATLNVLYGRRLESQEKIDDAIEVYRCGLRLGVHLNNDGVLISSMLAENVLTLNLRPLLQLAGKGPADAARMARFENAIAGVPAYGFDWSRAPFREKEEMTQLLFAHTDKADLKRAVQDLFGSLKKESVWEVFLESLHCDEKDLDDPARFRVILEKARQEYGHTLEEAAAAFRMPYLAANEKLVAFEKKTATLFGWRFMLFLPTYRHMNERRAVLEAYRAGLLGMIALRRYRLAHGQDATSLDGLDVPADPFTGKPFVLNAGADGLELRGAGENEDETPLVFRLSRN